MRDIITKTTALAFKFLLSAGVFLCTGCHNRISTQGNNTLRIAMSHDPISLDPRSASLSKDLSLAYALYEGLLRDNAGELVNGIAEKYTVSQDGTTYLFFLKQVQWSNGDEITAYDFEESIKQIYQKEVVCSSSTLPLMIKNAQEVMNHQLPIDSLGIRAIDNHTLEIILEKPQSCFLNTVAHPVFFPVHKTLRDYYTTGKSITLPITNGPFIISNYQPQNQLILKKNPLYHDRDNVSLNTIVFQIVPDSYTATQMLQKDLIDWIGSPWSSPISKEDQMHISEEKFHSYPVLGTMALICNLNTSPLYNLALRRALSYAIDKASLLQFINNCEVAESFLPCNLSRYNDYPKLTTEERRKKAQFYFKEAEKTLSSKQISELSIIYPLESGALNAIIQEIQQQIKNVLGIHINIQGMEYHCFVEKRNRGDFSLATGKWMADYPQPSSFLAILGNLKQDQPTQSLTKWDNPEYNNLLCKLYFSRGDENDQRNAEHLIAEDLPIIPLYHFKYSYAINPKINNLYESALGYIDIKRLEIVRE
nr:peptide ABC transporter substrate-binding protein [Chlamydia ibidis]